MANFFQFGDSIHDLLRKILAKLNSGISISGSESASNEALEVTGNIGGFSVVLDPDPLLAVSDNQNFVSDDLLGFPLEFKNAFREDHLTGVLESLTIVDRRLQAVALEVIFLERVPTNATLVEEDPVSWNGDEYLITARVSVAANDYVTIGNVSVAHVKGIGSVLKSTNTSQWALVVTKGAPNYTREDDLSIRVGILQD